MDIHLSQRVNMIDTTKLKKLIKCIIVYFYIMAESHILIELFLKLKEKLYKLDSMNVMMDVQGKQGMSDAIHACNVMDAYIDSFVYKEEHVVPVGVTYDQAYFSLSPTPKGHVGPSLAMRRYAANEEKKQMNRIDQAILMGKQLDARKDIPYFTIS